MTTVNLNLNIFAKPGVNLSDETMGRIQTALRKGVLSFVFEIVDECFEAEGKSHQDIEVDGRCKVVQTFI